jgi:hypothetical protein
MPATPLASVDDILAKDREARRVVLGVIEAQATQFAPRSLPAQDEAVVTLPVKA